VQARASGTCEQIVVGDPSASDVRFDGLGGAFHAGKATGGAEGAAILEAIAVQAEAPVILGTPGDDNFAGSVIGDSVNGQDGNDTIRGGGGDDEIRGDDGADQLFGEDGDDLLFGDSGNDVLDGGPGNDALEGGRGGDVLRGGDGDDALNGGFDPDQISGGNGNDVVTVVSSGTDTVDCGPGFDRVTKDRFDHVVNCESIG
jgi:Ca2+-binding RTX toxin-like protein